MVFKAMKKQKTKNDKTSVASIPLILKDDSASGSSIATVSVTSWTQYKTWWIAMLPCHQSGFYWVHQCSTGSWKCLPIGFLCHLNNKMQILKKQNKNPTVFKLKFHFAGNLRGFAPLCLFRFGVEFLENKSCLQKRSLKQLSKAVMLFRLWLAEGEIRSDRENLKGMKRATTSYNTVSQSK